MKNILLIGGGGHCLTVIDSLNRDNYNIIGIIDTSEKIGHEICGISIVGRDDDLCVLRDKYDSAFIALGSIGSWIKRKELAVKLAINEYSIPVVIHPSAVVSAYSDIATGVLVGPSAIVNSHSRINEMCIINTGSIVEHQCIIGAYAHIAPGAVLCAGVTVGKGSHIGAGSIVRQGITVGDNVLVGIGSVITRDIPDNVIAFGNPCKVMGQRESV